MKISGTLLLTIGVSLTVLSGGDRKDEVYRSSRPARFMGIQDRAGGTHNVSNIGLFFENRGKLYPRRLTDGPSGEFPINSGRHYIYRINPMVAVAANPSQGRPVNVMQGRFTQNEEWEAVGGDHNPDLAKIAFSDNAITWPASGWPVKDAAGNPLIVSDQDSYCIYDDSENSVENLGIKVIQTGYAYGLSLAEDMLFFKYEIVNNGSRNLDGVYFSLYSDMDIGNVSGGVPEWEDDMLNIIPEKNCTYFYDWDDYSPEWGGATGYFGIAYLQTPLVDGVEPGLTEMHWNTYYDDIDNDSLLFGIISSDLSYFPGAFDPGVYFHPGSQGDSHFDDPTALPDGGQDVVGWLSSGPYDLAQGDTLTFTTVIVAGVDLPDMETNLDIAFDVLNNNFNLPKPPPTPGLAVIPGNSRNTLFWGGQSESAIDAFTGEMDFEGYRIFRSLDRGVHWDNIDRNFNPAVGPDPIPLAEFDIVNGIGDDSGLQYSYIDKDVVNGFEYWYSLVAFDRGSDIVESLQSPIGKSLDAINTVSAIPRSSALGQTPGGAEEVLYTGSSRTNYTVVVDDIRNADLAGNSYSIDFEYVIRNEIGDLRTVSQLLIADSSITKPHRYIVDFLADGKIHWRDLTAGGEASRDYNYREDFSFYYRLDGTNFKIAFDDIDTLYLPEEGDAITVNFSATIIRSDGDTVLADRPLGMNQSQTTDDGILFRIVPEYIHDFTYSAEDLITVDLQVDSLNDLLDTAYVLAFSGYGLDSLDLPQLTLMIYFDAIDSLVQFGDPLALHNGDEFQIPGFTGLLTFDESQPPAQEVLVRFTSLAERPPSLMDAFQLTIAGPSFSSAVAESGIKGDTIRVVPNPYVTSSLWEPEFGELRYEPLRQIQFINLPPECDIFIYTIAGDLIKTLDHTNSTGTEVWDLRADGGREIAPGIYLYVVRSGDLEYFNRFAVIK